MCCKIFSVLKIQINMWNSQEDLSSQFEANPCITGPFLKRIRSGTASSNSIKMKNHNHETKKNVHQWLRLQEIFHRIKDCETNEEKYGLYLSKYFRLFSPFWHNFHSKFFVGVWFWNLFIIVIWRIFFNFLFFCNVMMLQEFGVIWYVAYSVFKEFRYMFCCTFPSGSHLSCPARGGA